MFDRETYTPCTPEELPSFATKAFMIAARSDRVAGLADELLATAAAAAVSVSAVTARVAANERKVTAPNRSPTAWERTRDERSLIDSSRPRAPTAYRERDQADGENEQRNDSSYGEAGREKEGRQGDQQAQTDVHAKQVAAPALSPRRLRNLGVSGLGVALTGGSDHRSASVIGPSNRVCLAH